MWEHAKFSETYDLFGILEKQWKKMENGLSSNMVFMEFVIHTLTYMLRGSHDDAEQGSLCSVHENNGGVQQETQW